MKKIKFAIASDHAAYKEKAALITYLESLSEDQISYNNDVDNDNDNDNKSLKLEAIDLGTNSEESCHYPEFVFKLVNSLQKKECQFGILLCGTGIGVSIVANRFQNIRAGLCRSIEEVKLTRQHNDANVLCLGARISSLDELKQMSIEFINQSFEGDRHQLRLNLFNQLGEINVPKK